MAGAHTTARPYMAKAWPRFGGREGVGEDGLFGGCKAAAANALQDAAEDKERKRRSDAAESRADAEERDADHVELLAPDEGGHVGAGGEDDGVGYEIRGEDPGGFVLRGAEAAGDVGQGDVADGGVEDLHEGGEGDRHGDDPRVDAGAPWALYRGSAGDRYIFSIGGWRWPSTYLDSMVSCGGFTDFGD